MGLSNEQKILEQEILLGEILGKPRDFILNRPELLADPAKYLSKKQLQRFKKDRRKLQAGWPLAYLLGYKWFYGEKFAVNKNVLIPRPETELLVEKALELSKSSRFTEIIDVGCGSGAIIVSLRKNIKTPANFYGTDISAAALKTARANARRLTKNSKIKFVLGNLLKPLGKILKRRGGKILICANLPYLSKKELFEPSIKHEPKLALYGGKKSTDKIAELLKQAGSFNRPADVLLEIGYFQGQAIKKLAKKYLPGYHAQIFKDYSGFDRIVLITR